MLNTTCGLWLPHWIARDIPTDLRAPVTHTHTTSGCRWHLRLLQCWARLQSLVLAPPWDAQILPWASPHPPTCFLHHLPGDTVWKPSHWLWLILLCLAHSAVFSLTLLTCLQSKAGRISFLHWHYWPRSDDQSWRGPAYTSQDCQFFSLSASLAHGPFCSVRGSLLRTGWQAEGLRLLKQNVTGWEVRTTGVEAGRLRPRCHRAGPSWGLSPHVQATTRLGPHGLPPCVCALNVSLSWNWLRNPYGFI